MNTIITILILAGGVGFAWILLAGKGAQKGGSSPHKGSSHKNSKHGQGAKDQVKKTSKKAGKSNGKGSLNQFFPISEKFSGRGKELTLVQQKLDQGTTLLGFQGISGIGKTAMASQVALSQLSYFPEAQIYLDLKAGRPKPLSSSEVMARIIHCFHPREKLPKTKAEISNRYKLVLKNKRAILFFDNLEDVVRAKSLIPPKTCLLITTSEKVFSLPGMYSQPVEGLESDDALELFQTFAPRVGLSGKETIKLCANVPLALVLAAKFLAFYNEIDPSQYSGDLRSELNRLGSRSGLGLKVSLEAVFNVTYKNLPEPTANVLCKLLVFPETFTKRAEIFVCEDEESGHLGTLITLGLAMHNEINDRYYIHNEIRQYLKHRLKEANRSKAVTRHAAYYLNILVSANQSFSRGEEGIDIGLQEFDLEWDNIKAGFEWAQENGSKDQDATRLCSSYTESGAGMLIMRQPLRECLRWYEAALSAARQMKDAEAEKSHLLNLGRAYNRLKEYRQSIEYLDQAQNMARELDDKDSERIAVHELGMACLITEDSHRAVSCFQRELVFTRSSDDRSSEQQLLENLGWAYRKEGQLKDSAKIYEESLELAQKKGNKDRMGYVLKELGEVHTALGNPKEAIKYLEQGFNLARESKDKNEEETYLKLLGNSHLESGDTHKAIVFFKQGLKLAQSTGNKKSVGDFFKNLGASYAIAKDNNLAISHYQNAATVFNDIGASVPEGESLWSMSRILSDTGDQSQAIEHAQTALKIFQNSGHPDAEKVSEKLDQWNGKHEKEIPPPEKEE